MYVDGTCLSFHWFWSDVRQKRRNVSKQTWKEENTKFYFSFFDDAFGTQVKCFIHFFICSGWIVAKVYYWFFCHLFKVDIEYSAHAQPVEVYVTKHQGDNNFKGNSKMVEWLTSFARLSASLLGVLRMESIEEKKIRFGLT